jgi:Asp-tRNA(Asn)/Glu-tRNA(Gln) amidotransferase A subunit family amidase
MTSTYDPNSFAPLQFHTKLASFEAGTESPRQYLERCLETIAAREPIVQGWVVLNETGAREQADASAARWRSGRPLSQIDGMPIGIKDLLETKDMPTQMGAAAYAGNFPKRDNAAVWALRQAGAVILGKTVTAEMGGTQPGPTTNPFNPGHTPGGSSSGSAAVVGACMVPAAIGTQVGGSIVRPASYCGNYALKPSQGAINRGERQATSMSTHGPHAGSLEDMWAVAIEIAIRAGGDPGRTVLSGPMKLPIAHTPSVLAVMETEGWSALAPAAKSAFEQVISQIERAGVTVVRRKQWPELDHFEHLLDGVRQMANTITAWENHWGLRNLLASNPEGVSQRGRSGLEVAERLGVQGYQDLLKKRELIRNHHALLATGADAMIAPASPGPAPAWSGDLPGQPLAARPTGDSVFNTPSSVLGTPVVTCPLTAVENLPMGIQIMGWPGTDAKVTAVARWLRDNVRPVRAS